MDDEQIGFEIEFDDKTQAFLDWVASDRMETRVREFLTKTAPDMPDDSEWWKPPLSTQIMEAAKALFCDLAGFLASENYEFADGFVRFLGECYVRRGGMTWTNRPEWGPPLYANFGPAVDGDDTRGMAWIAKILFKDDGPERIEDNITDAARQTRKSRTVR
ncbi:hypothetical protein AB0H00_02590 [Nocardia sp. NPDC023852]|uniref:hypothetical protein n=1 Tax=Nocardia sp. NPDC023852 TaxID=3154697 RepID=UPI0033E26D36